MVPVGISISYLSNGGATQLARPVRDRSQPTMSAGASPAAKSIPRSSETYSGFRGPAGAGLIDLREVTLAQAQVLGRDLEQLVVGEEVERLLQAQFRGGGEPHRDVGSRRADVRLLLLPADVDPDVARASLHA